MDETATRLFAAEEEEEEGTRRSWCGEGPVRSEPEFDLPLRALLSYGEYRLNSSNLCVKERRRDTNERQMSSITHSCEMQR